MDFKKLVAVFFLQSVLFFAHAGSGDVIKVLSDANNVAELKKKQGYLLVYVNVEGVAPSIEFSRINTRKTDVMLPDEKITYVKDYFLDLKNIEKGFYFIPMFAGIYQITRVNAPFYDLPYWLPTEKSANWRFAIEENAVNFIGELNIEKERGKRVINVHLFNRTALYHDELIEQISLLPIKLPLKVKAGYRDDFLMVLEK